MTRESLPASMLAPAGASAATVTPRTAMAAVDVLACVRALAHAAAVCPFHVHRRDEHGRARVRDGAALVLATPASGVTPAMWTAHLFTHLALHGEAFIGLYRDAGDVVNALGILAPDRIEVSILPNGEPQYRWSRSTGAPLDLTARDVAHVRLTTLDGLRGVSPISAARDAVGLALDLQTAAAANLANDGAPTGVLRVAPGPGADEMARKVEERWSKRHEGPKNRGRIAVLTGGDVSFEAVSLPAKDLQFVEQRGLSTAEIARLIGVPPWVVNAPVNGSLTYSTVSGQGEAFARFSLAPWLTAVEQALSAVPDFLRPSEYIEAEMSGLLRGTAAERAAFYTAALHNETGWMTRPEVRDRENLPRETATTPKTEVPA